MLRLQNNVAENASMLLKFSKTNN